MSKLQLTEQRLTPRTKYATGELPKIDSIWAEALPPLASLTATPLRVRTAVVGAGLAGLSAAYHLLARFPERELVVLDAEGLGGGASSRSTGMLTPGVGQNLPALVRRLGAARARELYLESLHAVSYAAELVARESIVCELALGGQLVVAHGPSGRARLRVQARALAALDLPHELLDDAALAGRVRVRVPDGGADSGPAAIRLPNAGSLHPGKLLAGLARAVERRGGRLFGKARVVEIGAGSPVRLTLASGGEVIADEVVLAVNGYGAQLGVHQGRVLPLHLRLILSEPLSRAALTALGWAQRDVVLDSRRLFNYYRLTSDDRILFGGGLPRYAWRGDTRERSPGSDGRRLARALAATFALEPTPAVVGSWSGVIGYVLDALPVVERLARNPAVLSVGGWCGHGIALSLASGIWLAELSERGASQLLPFRARAPWVPSEPARWLGVRASSWLMAGLDRW